MSEYANWCGHGVRMPDVCPVCDPEPEARRPKKRRRVWLAFSILGVCLALGAEDMPQVCRVSEQVAENASRAYHSAATLLAWKLYRVNHPGWRPKLKPKLAAPKTRLEALAALEFACAPVPTLDAVDDGLLPLDEPPPMEFALDEDDFAPPVAAPVPETSEDVAVGAYPAASYPYQSPYLFFVGEPLPPKHCKKCKEPPPPVVAPVPEPWPLLLTACGACGLLFRRRTARTKSSEGI